MIIDSHQHFWQIERGDYHWMTSDQDQLYRDYLPSDLAPLQRARDVKGSIVVQAAETENETRYLLDIAKTSESVLGVVGWVDMNAPDVCDRLDKLMIFGEGMLKGIRPMIQDIPDPNWILDSTLDRAFEALEERGLVFEALVQPIHLPQLESRLRRQPHLNCVIDHGAKPYIELHARSAWSDAMCSIARNTSAYCKLSGLVTEAGQNWKPEDIRPYVSDLVYHFGASRMIWGSDWPVLNLASDYASWFDLAQKSCHRLSEQERAKVFGQNAIDLYGLEVACLQ